MNSTLKTVLSVVGILLVAGAAYMAWKASDRANQVACTMEALMCPDGSFVGRSGPKCEFAACPGAASVEGWQMATDIATNISFQYPQSLDTTYTSVVDWPPKIEIPESTFTCSEAGKETARTGKTEMIDVDGRAYCRTKIVEGAAGTAYTEYAYAFPTGGERVLIFTFSLKSPNCANYDDPEKTACEAEQEGFSADSLVDQIRKTIKFPETL